MTKNKFGKISYRDHKGVILDDGRSIKDNDIGTIYESSIHWISFWDIEEGRKPPTVCYDAPYSDDKCYDEYQEVFDIDLDEENYSEDNSNFIMETPIEELLYDMNSCLTNLRNI